MGMQLVSAGQVFDIGRTWVDTKNKAKSILFLTISFFLTFSSIAFSASTLPTGGDITAGSGSINQTEADMTINQTSQNMVIDWQGFSIGVDNSVTFEQPSATSAVLNRVVSSEISNIQGALKANGRVFLINPNGVLFSNTACINVGDLVVSTLNISNEEFVSGNYDFNGNSPGQIINKGDINASDGGYVVFIAARIENTGNITANSGGVLLGSGSRVVLDLGGPVKLKVEESAIDALIQQGGAIRADGGLVYISAKAAGDLTSTVINHTGITEARTLATGENGEIYLLGDMENDRIAVSGTLDASAPNGGDGGFIETSAAKVKIEDDVHVTTKAEDGETGTWLIDPNDFTIASSGGDMTGTLLSTNLSGGNIEILSSSGSSGTNGDIFVNDSITWDANKLTLNAWRNIEINSELFGSGSAQLALYYGQGAVAADNTSTYSINAPVNLPAGENFSTRLGSDGVEKTYYVITELGDAGSATGEDLQGMSGGLAGYYALGSDIDASDTATSEWGAGGFDPIGYASYKFTGNFDGLGHTITDLYINRPSTRLVGLFGDTDAADIRNVGLEGGSVTGNSLVGGLVGDNYNNSTVSNSYATGSVTGDDYVGGLVGRNQDSSTVSNSYATGSVTGVEHVGGLVGHNYKDSTVSDSYATGSVTATDTVNNRVGGLVGNNDDSSTISNSYATGSVDGTGNLVGGLVGYNYDSSTISNSYATGSVTGDEYVGGLVGYNYSSVTVTNSYATGAVEGTGDYVGGLVGYHVSGTITNSFWDKETTGQTTSAGSLAAFGKTTEDMKKEATYENWDFTGIWWIDEGNTYPLLRSCQTPVTLTAVDSSKVYDGASYSSWSYTASSSSYNEGKVSGTADYGGLAKEAIDFGSYELTLGGLFSNQYYLITLVNGTLDITSKALTLAATAANKDYDGNTTATVAGYGLSGFIGTETVTASSTGALFDTKDAGTDKTVTIAGITLANGEYGGLASNYSVAGNTTATADITARPVNVMADSKTKEETEIDPPLTYQVEAQTGDRGLVTGESLIGALIRVIGETSGIYEIQQGTVVDAENLNYEISYTPADLMITEKNDGVPEALRISILNVRNLAARTGSGYGGYNNSSISNSYAAESGHVNGEINLPEAVRLWLNSNPD